ncbi:hypothetical protein L6164_012507 [Bauhinia variegata]|uniref:Uncharacterized protein n=1 Tax=Bauhinia variegata TaxID=167791 RepID=A0ACB9PAC4_BAUVA|nr:hypothetical protein L6164_012507 [Bauhinia variegata]
MKSQENLASYVWHNTPVVENLCKYKFYPTYMAATVVQTAPNPIIQVKAEDNNTCNEAASRFIPEKITKLQPRGVMGW